MALLMTPCAFIFSLSLPDIFSRSTGLSSLLKPHNIVSKAFPKILKFLLIIIRRLFLPHGSGQRIWTDPHHLSHFFERKPLVDSVKVHSLAPGFGMLNWTISQKIHNGWIVSKVGFTLVVFPTGNGRESDLESLSHFSLKKF